MTPFPLLARWERVHRCLEQYCSPTQQPLHPWPQPTTAVHFLHYRLDGAKPNLSYHRGKWLRFQTFQCSQTAMLQAADRRQWSETVSRCSKHTSWVKGLGCNICSRFYILRIVSWPLYTDCLFWSICGVVSRKISCLTLTTESTLQSCKICLVVSHCLFLPCCVIEHGT